MSIIYKGLAEHFQRNKDDQDIDLDLQGSYSYQRGKNKQTKKSTNNIKPICTFFKGKYSKLSS